MRVVGAVAIVLLLIVSGFAGAIGGLSRPVTAQSYLQGLGAQANASLAANSVTGPIASELRSGGPSSLTASAIEESTATLLGQYGELAAKVPASAWQQEIRAFQTGNFHFLDGYVTAGISVAGIIAVAIVCAATAGIGCVAAVLVVGLIIVIANLLCPISNLFGSSWGCSPPGGAAQSSFNTASALIGKLGEAANVQAVAIANLVQTLTLTQTALSYEAAAAALSQLPNASFNSELDAAQSGVAQQLASIFYADGTTLASIAATGAEDFNYYEGAGNTIGFYCPATFQYPNFRPPTVPDVPGGNTGTAGVCQNSFSSALNLLYGSVYGSWQGISPGTVASPSACPSFFLQNGETVNAQLLNTSGSGILTLVPVEGGPWINMTLTASATGSAWDLNHSLNIPLGGANGMGYHVCSTQFSGSDTVLELFANFAMPLDNAAFWGSIYNSTCGGSACHSSAPTEWVGTPNVLPSGAIGAKGTNYEMFDGSSLNHFLSCVGLVSSSSLSYDASIEGGNTNATMANPAGGCPQAAAQTNLGLNLLILERYAFTVGAAYWGFLRFSLGFTSASQVPVQCLIPSPSQLLPPNTPLNVLQTMNVTTLLNWYQAALRALGNTFNLNSSLNSTTFCGKHPKWSPWNTTVGWGIFAAGFVFVPGSGVKSSDGAVNQNFGKPTTWNYSGLLYIAPTVANLSQIPLNSTFALPVNNPSQLFIQPYLVNNATHGSTTTGLLTVNRTGPIWCNNGHSTGCGSNSLYNIVTGFVIGNSTAGGGLTGSVYPSNVAAGAGVSVYLTACYVAVQGNPTANPTYQRTNTCQFSEARINATGWTCNGNVLYQGGVPVGQCKSGTGPILFGVGTCPGDATPIWGSIVDAVAGALGGSGGLFGFACIVGDVVALLLLVGVVALIAWALVAVVRRRD